MTRHEIREAALLLLYQIELNKSEFDETLEINVEAFGLKTNSYVEKLVKGVKQEKETIDNIISEYSKTRVITRISLINLIIMRMAVYEMNYTETPDKVAVNEAIELSKEYSEKKDSAFISGLLGSYFREKNNGNDNE